MGKTEKNRSDLENQNQNPIETQPEKYKTETSFILDDWKIAFLNRECHIDSLGVQPSKMKLVWGKVNGFYLNGE